MLLVILRIIGLATVTLFFAILAVLVYPIMPKRFWVYVLKIEAKCLVFLIGIKIEVEGVSSKYVEKNAVVIANHISWIDIPVLYTQHSVEFIAKSDIKKWPIVGLLAKSGNTIFVDRDRRHSVTDTIKVLSERLKAGETIGLFPEGKTGSGLEILPFKSSLFESVILTNAKVIPLLVQYYTKEGKPTKATTYAKKITFWQCLINSLKLNGFKVKITRLPPVHGCEFTNREDLANSLHKHMCEQFKT